jgi:signal transduction histidine kinase
MDQKQKTILIVDREKGVAAALTELLPATCRVYQAFSAEEALGILKRESPDLVLSDRPLPGRTTVELFHQAPGIPSNAVLLLPTGMSDLGPIAARWNKTPSGTGLPSSWEAGQIEKIILAIISLRLQQCLEQQRGMEQQLTQQAKMASLGELVAGVLHEINNPLAFISTNLQNLLKFSRRLTGLIEGYDRLVLPDEIRAEIKAHKEAINYDYLRGRITEMVEQSIAGAERMKKTIQDYKSFSRSEQAGLVAADLHGAIDSTLTLLFHEYKNRIEIKKIYGVLPPVRCHISKLNQVFMNLLANAIQAIEGPGTITIKTGMEEGKVVVAISDTGCGIPEEALPKIFDPFFTTKPDGVGTGLGLSIIQGIVELHRGQLAVESRVGVGTTFTLTLPLTPPTEENP